MAKREIPLFIIDTSRAHGRGECDFIVCTDRDSGFIARVDYISEEREEAGDDYRIGYPRNGISLRMQIVQHTGANMRQGDVRTLLKRGMDYYARAATRPMDIGSPSRRECAEFLRTLAMANMHNIDSAGSDYTQRQTVMRSISMLQASADHLDEEVAQ